MLDDYLNLIPSANRNKPLFTATMALLCGGAVSVQTFLTQIRDGFDIDTAIGPQLDIIGLWVGAARQITIPLTDVFFTWGAATLGWGAGIWRGKYDPATTPVLLPDDTYRLLIKAKILANHWDGSIPQAYEIWNALFQGSLIIDIIDHQNMTMTVKITGAMTEITRQLIVGGFLPLKPAGVAITYETA